MSLQEQFSEAGLTAIWHFTPISNLESILELGAVLSHSLLSANTSLSATYASDASSRSRGLERGGAAYVYCSFIPWTPFYAKARRKMAWLRFSLDIISNTDVHMAYGNRQGSVPRRLDGLVAKLFPLANEIRPAEDANGAPVYGPLFDLDLKTPKPGSFYWDVLSFELLIPQQIELAHYCEGIYLPDGDHLLIPTRATMKR